MRHKIKRALMAAFIVCATYTTVYAEPMKLTYDGEIHDYNLKPITLYINSKPVETTIMPPIQLGDRVVVPAREVFEPMGATVEWRSSERKVYVYDTTSLIVLEVDNGEAFVNGEMKSLDMPPKMINDKLMIPIRFISEQLGFNVLWEGNMRTVAIDKPVAPPVEVLPDVPEVLPDVPPGEIPNVPGDWPEGFVEFIPLPEPVWLNTLDRIDYIFEQDILILEKHANLTAGNISVIDLFRERKLIINLNGNYSEFFKGGSLVSSGGRVKNVTIDHRGNTSLVVDTFSISEVNIYEQDNQIHIKFIKPNEKYNQIVVIDAGHGGSDPGATVNGVKEKELNIRYAMDVYQLLLSNPSIKVYMTRETDFKPSLQERAEWSNEIGAHLFISIHNNAATNKAINGAETFYFSNPNDTRSQEFAKMIQANIVQGLNMSDRKAKVGNGLYVLKNTTMPAVLLEIGFMSNPQDLNKLNQPNFSPRVAQIIYDSIVVYFANGNHLMY